MDEGGVRQLHGGEDREPERSRRSTTSCGSSTRTIPAAYDVDRTEGTNAIRQRLDNLNEAGSLYGAIIYQKAPIVMRQLEMIVTPDGLRDGLREYLKQHSFANATWPDLIALLDRRTPEDLAAWSRAWVEEAGRPTITT